MRLEKELVWPVLEISLCVHELLAMWLHWWNWSTAWFHRLRSKGPTLTRLHGLIGMLLLPILSIALIELIVILEVVILVILIHAIKAILIILEAVVVLWETLCIREHLLLVVTIDVSIVFVETVGVLLLPCFCILSLSKFSSHSILYFRTDSTH